MSYLREVSNTLFVDAALGNDAQGKRGNANQPFLTPAAALAAASSGDLVFIRPGTYNLAAGLTIPDGVAVRGASAKACTLQMLAVAADTVLVTMGENTRLEDVTLNLSTTGAYALTGIKYGGTSSANAKVRVCVVNVTKTVDTGAQSVLGVEVNSTGAPTPDVSAIRGSNIVVASTGTGINRAVYMHTGAGKFFCRDVTLKCTGGTNAIGASVNIAGATLNFGVGNISGQTADISQDAGTLELETTNLINNNANGKNFALRHAGSIIFFGVSGGASTGKFFPPGFYVEQANEIFLRVPRPGIVKNMAVRSRVWPGAGKTLTLTLRKGGVATALVVTLTEVETSDQNSVDSVAVMEGDELSIIITLSDGSVSDIMVSLEFY